MTLDEAKRLLSGQGIPFEVCEFENEATYWHHVTLFPYTKNAKNCKVIALVIPSPNGEKNIELQCTKIAEPGGSGGQAGENQKHPGFDTE